MKKKLLTVLLAATASLCLCFSLAACDFGGNPNDGHTHEYSQTWSYDNAQHWRECTGCDAKKDTAKHSFKNDICDICGCINGASELSVAGKSFVFDSLEITCDSEEMAEYAEQLKAQAEEQMKNDYITFGAGGICSVVSNGKIANGTYTQNGNTVSMTLGGETDEISVTENSVSVVTAMPNITLTVLYVKGTPQKPVIPDTPDKPENPNVCKHENLCFVEDHKDADCREEGYDLSVAVCRNIIAGDASGNIPRTVCGTVLSWSESGSKVLGKLNINSEYEFGNWIESGEIKNYLSEYRTVISKIDHTPVIDEAVPATCSTKGLTEGSHCGVCNTVLKEQTETDFADHSYTDTLMFADRAYNVCPGCGKIENSELYFKATYNESGDYFSIDELRGLNDFIDFSSYQTYNGKPIIAIGSGAFKDNTALKHIIIGGGIKYISNSAFAGCTSLTTVDFCYQNKPEQSVEVINENAFQNCTAIKKLEFPDTLKRIHYYAFWNCTALTELIFPEGLTSIGGGSFDGCENLEKITWNAISCVHDIPKTMFSKITAFLNCKKLHTVIIGNNVEKVPKYLFVNNWENLISGNDVEQGIESSAFYNCDNLTSVTIGKKITNIGDYAFYGCSNLTSITIPDSVTSIGNSAFIDCTGLTNIIIPDSVTSIGYYAFSGCSSLTSITFKDTIEQWNAISKNWNWNSNTGDYTIHCTDGDIVKS